MTEKMSNTSRLNRPRSYSSNNQIRNASHFVSFLSQSLDIYNPRASLPSPLKTVEEDRDSTLVSSSFQRHSQLISQIDNIRGEEDEESNIYKNSPQNIIKDENEEENEVDVHKYIQKLLNKNYPQLQFTSKALNTLNSFIDNFAVSLLEEIHDVSSESNKVESSQVSKAIKNLLGEEDKPTKILGSNQLTEYYHKIDKTNSYYESFLKVSDWKFFKEKQAISIFYRNDVKKNELFLRATGIINGSPQVIMQIMMDLEMMKQWDSLFQEGSVIEHLDNHTQIVHMKYAAQVCLLRRARDFVCIRHWFQKDDGSYLITACSIEHPNCPEIEDYVRGKIFGLLYHLRPISKQKTEVTILNHLNVRVVNENLKDIFFRVILERYPLCIEGIRKCTYIRK